ncbi:hypothetical protein CEV31_3386 [Brucella thiophenivorans]|uniref:Uncharacterized protein n=1 Tax=Brucella thiophenivorans TaxID=571255 RepID=A0A256FG59_9HYPH|nr:hypothetical protein CEV31_3386 [Brucella thiophenivorans]
MAKDDTSQIISGEVRELLLQRCAWIKLRTLDHSEKALSSAA